LNTHTCRMLAAFVVVTPISAQAGSTDSGYSYPNKPIRIVTSGIGGGADVGSRLFVPLLNFGQQLVIENRASGVIPGEIVSRANPDGYTLLIYSSTLWIGPLLQKTPYDAVRDFAPVVWISRAPNLIVVHPSLPINSVKELIAYAKANPGKLNYASGSSGSSNHLAAELFKSMAGVNLVRIAYKSGALQMADLVGGQVQMMFPNAGSVAPHTKSGRLRTLAVTSAEPSALLPGVPTVAASGLAGYESISMVGMWAPAKTPRVLINRLNQESVRALKSSEARERYLNVGVELVGGTPEAFAAYIKSDVARWTKLIKEAGIRDE
jgi:tripartite-type tricarboxylate transporter receptor subunit TctC